MSEYFAKIYIDTVVKHHVLLALTSDAAGGEIRDKTVEASGVEIDVCHNDDFYSPYRIAEPNDFVYFPFSLDVEAVDEGVTLSRFISLISTLMLCFQSAGMRVVVACDWELDLPGGGRLGFK